MAWGRKIIDEKHSPCEIKIPSEVPYCPPPLERLRIAFHWLVRFRSIVHRAIRRFAVRFESELGRQALETGADIIRIELEASEPVVRSVKFGSQKKKIFLEEYEPLWSLVQEIGISRIVLDPRIGRKQIEEVFGLLSFYRYELAKDPQQPETAEAVRGLRRPEGMQIRWIRIGLGDSTLTAVSLLYAWPASDIETFRQIQEQAGKDGRRIQAEIQKAKEIQNRMLPVFETLPYRDRILWSGRVLASAKAGGDFFDIRRADAGKLAFLFCDVAGDGMSAACTAAILKISFGACLDRKLSLRAMTEHLNTELCRLAGAEDFAAVFVGMYNPSTHVLMYCSAGQNPEPWRIPAEVAEPIQPLREARNLLLGVEPKTEYKTARCRLKAGDKLVLVSDGILRSEDVSGNEYGTSSLETLLERYRGEPANKLIERLFHSLEDFMKGGRQRDDWAVLAADILL